MAFRINFFKKSIDFQKIPCYNIVKKRERKEEPKMKKLQNKVIAKYGFENWRTILVFKISEIFGR